MNANITTIQYYDAEEPHYKRGVAIVRNCVLTKAAWDAIATCVNASQLRNLQGHLQLKYQNLPMN